MSKSSVQPWAFNEHQHDLADKLLVQSWWRVVLRVTIVVCKIQNGRSKRTGVRIVDHGVGNVTSPRYGYPFLLWSSFSSVLLRVSRSRKPIEQFSNENPPSLPPFPSLNMAKYLKINQLTNRSLRMRVTESLVSIPADLYMPRAAVAQTNKPFGRQGWQMQKPLRGCRWALSVSFSSYLSSVAMQKPLLWNYAPSSD